MIPFPKKTYNIIYADPPWTFDTYSIKGKGRSPEQHYDCMTLKDIENLPIGDLADKDCVSDNYISMHLSHELVYLL